MFLYFALVSNASKHLFEISAKVHKKCSVALKWKGSIVLNLGSIA